MKSKAYIGITLLLVALPVGFYIGQIQVRSSEKLSDKEQKIQRLQKRVNALEVYENYHRMALDLTTLAVLTETKKPGEMIYVANVIRNRVRMCWRGNCTYIGVVSDPYQFSGIWRRARRLTKKVMLSRESTLPLDSTVTHFYSPRSVESAPLWAHSRREIDVPKINQHRFKFYE